MIGMKMYEEGSEEKEWRISLQWLVILLKM